MVLKCIVVDKSFGGYEKYVNVFIDKPVVLCKLKRVGFRLRNHWSGASGNTFMMSSARCWLSGLVEGLVFCLPGRFLNCLVDVDLLEHFKVDMHSLSR